MPTTKRKYTRRTKLATILTAELTNPAATAITTGIPESTIRYWMDDPSFAEFRAKTRDDMVDATALLAHRILERIRRHSTSSSRAT